MKNPGQLIRKELCMRSDYTPPNGYIIKQFQIDPKNPNYIFVFLEKSEDNSENNDIIA
jgi:hypothetical protein